MNKKRWREADGMQVWRKEESQNHLIPNMTDLRDILDKILHISKT